MIRLSKENNTTPAGVIRIVHPALRCRAREGWEALEGSIGLAIIASKNYFTRCKKCAQAVPGSFFEPGAVKLVVHARSSKQLGVSSLLDNPPALDDQDAVGIYHRR